MKILDLELRQISVRANHHGEVMRNKKGNTTFAFAVNQWLETPSRDGRDKGKRITGTENFLKKLGETSRLKMSKNAMLTR